MVREWMSIDVGQGECYGERVRGLTAEDFQHQSLVQEL
jgi:hypothetical protein